MKDSPAEVFTGFIPRRQQLELRKSLKRFNVIVTHRRFGKTVFAVNHMIDKALTNNNPMPRYAYIAPNYQMAKRIVWDLLKRYSSMIPTVSYNEADLRVDFASNQSRIMLLSAENYESLKGIYLDGVVLDEHAQMSPSVWNEAIRPTLVDRKGWAIFTSTPKGQNQFYELYEYAKDSKDVDWYSAVYRASETKIVDEGELASLQKSMSEEEYAQEFECDFNSGLIGAFFSKELSKAEKENRIREIPYDPTIPVDTFWDLGVNDSTAIWFVQSTRFEHRIIDYYEVCGAGLNTTIPEVKRYEYNFDEFVLPHDVAVRDLSTGRARLQMFYDFGIRRTRVVPRVGNKMDSVNAARVIFGKCYFDKVRCAKGLKALANYQRRWNDKGQCFENSPLHNWASNAADAFQCFGLGVRDKMDSQLGANNTRFMNNEEVLVADTDYNVFEGQSREGSWV